MNANPHRAPLAAEDRHEQLSALADGDAAALEDACLRWREDPEARARWHTYHLIGDVLRSDDLASTPVRDAAFLRAVRERLAAEPVVLAPPVPRRGRHWLLPGAAAAAGFVAVAGVVIVLRNGAPAPEAPVAAAAPQAGAVVPVVASPEVVIRDPKLERLLAMHRGAGGGFAAVPGATPRNLEVMATTPITPVVTPVPR